MRRPRPTIENPRDLYWFLASRKLHVYLDRSAYLHNFVLLVEEETVSLVSLEGPLPRILQVTATTLYGDRVATLTFCPLQQDFFDTARCHLCGTLVIQISDAVSNKASPNNFARAFAPLTLDPI